MDRKVKQLQGLSYMLAIVWAILFIANLIQDIVYWNQYEEDKRLVVVPFVVMLMISCSWLVISILHVGQARTLAKLENPEAVYMQKNRIKSKLIAAIILLVLSLPVKMAIRGYMDTIVPVPETQTTVQ